MENQLRLFQFAASDNVSQRQVFFISFTYEHAQEQVDRNEGVHCIFIQEIRIQQNSHFSVTTWSKPYDNNPGSQFSNLNGF